MESATLPQEIRETSIHDYLAILYRRRYLAALVLLLTMGYALVSSLRTPPRYSSSATLVVEAAGLGGRTETRLTELLEGPGSTSIGTLAEILKSRAVASRAVRRAGLDLSEVDSIRNSIRVTPVRGSSVISIAVTDRFPQRAALLANAVSEEFIELSLEVRKRQAVATRRFLEEQVGVVGREVRAAEGRVLDFKVQEGNIELPLLVNMQISRLVNFETARTEARLEQRVAGVKMQEVRQRLGQLPEISASSFGRDPSVNSLRQALVTVEIDLAVLRERYTDDHPAVIAARDRIAQMRSSLQQLIAKGLEPLGYGLDPISSGLRAQLVTTEVERVGLQAREQALSSLINQVNQEIATLPPKELTLARLTRDLRIAESTFLLLSQRFQDARIAEASVVPEIRILDAAEAPSAPFAPNTKRNVLFGVILGVVFALGAAMGADYVDRSIRTAEDAERATGLPVLAVIPAVSLRGRRRGEGDFTIRGEFPVANHKSRKSTLAEAFRGLRTSLLFSSPDRPLKTIMVTSAFPGEGKTTVAINLALSFAQLGREVLLVETDLRRQGLAHAFQPANPVGLVDYLVDAVSLDQAVKQLEGDHLEYIPVGSLPPNPAELIGSQKMGAFLETARERAEIVICDSAPLIPVADGLLLAPEVDGVILVVEAGRVPRDALQHVQRKLAAAGARILGVVLSKVRIGARGYGYGYYGYGYYGYGEEEEPPAQGREGHT